MSRYTIPNVFHFVWFGSSISPCEETLKAWRRLHPKTTINLWLSQDATLIRENTVSEIEKICKRYQITSRYIEEETHLTSRGLIVQEIKKGRYWSASDIARFAILHQEPGFYFDIGVIPKKPLPNPIDCTYGLLLIIDIPNSIRRNEFLINYNFFCSAYRNHSFFKKLLDLIDANFKFLQANPAYETKFYDDFPQSAQSVDQTLTKKQQADYVFARIVTGRIAQKVLSENYISNKTEESFTKNLKLFNLSLNYQSFLKAPLANQFDDDLPILKWFKRKISLQIIAQLSQKIDHPLVSKLNTIYQLDTDSQKKFFCLQLFYGDIHLLLPLSNDKSAINIKKFIQSKIGGKSVCLGDNRFFMFTNLHLPRQISKIQTLIDELATDDQSLVRQKTVFRN